MKIYQTVMGSPAVRLAIMHEKFVMRSMALPDGDGWGPWETTPFDPNWLSSNPAFVVEDCDIVTSSMAFDAFVSTTEKLMSQDKRMHRLAAATLCIASAHAPHKKFTPQRLLLWLETALQETDAEGQ